MSRAFYNLEEWRVQGSNVGVSLIQTKLCFGLKESLADGKREKAWRMPEAFLVMFSVLIPGISAYKIMQTTPAISEKNLRQNVFPYFV